MKRVVFRVDASVRIGTGHVMRCLTLADRLREAGMATLFLHRRHRGHMTDVIRARGHEVRTLRPSDSPVREVGSEDYAGWLGVTIAEDAAESLSVAGKDVDWLVVDHYGLDANWHGIMRERVKRVAVIDDLANRPLDCDLLLDQNYFDEPEARYKGLVPARAELLLGPRFALLAPEYATIRRSIRPRRPPPSRLLVYYGGSDMTGQTARALRVLGREEFVHLAVDVVVGPATPDKDRLVELAGARPGISLYGPRRSLVDLMSTADLMLGGGGGTSWERCALGLPALVTAIAPNQEPVARQLSEIGVVEYLGPAGALSDEDLHCALLQFLGPGSDRLRHMASAAWRITDGRGAARVADHLTGMPASMDPELDPESLLE